MAAALAGAASAEIGIGMWGRSWIEMIDYNTDTGYGYSVTGPSWSPAGRVGLNIWGNDEDNNMGFQFQIDYAGISSIEGSSTFYLDDNAKMWAQLGPARLTLGKMRENDMRGSGAFDDFYFGYGLALRDDMFYQLGLSAGIHLDITFEGLYAAVGFDAYNTETKVGYTYTDDDGTVTTVAMTEAAYNALSATDKAKYARNKQIDALIPNATTATTLLPIESFYKSVKAVLGYHIDGIGTAKVQFQANGFDKNEFINVGFNSSELVDGLEFEIGSKILLEAIDNGGLIIPVGVKYTGIDNVAVRFQAEFQNTTDPKLTFGLDGMYTMDNIDLGLATTYIIPTASSGTKQLTFVPFMGYHVGPGFVFAGADINVYIASSKTYATFGIPVGLQLSF